MRIDANLHRQLENHAKAIKVDESEVVREALKQYLSKHDSKQSAYEIFNKSGIVGLVRVAPQDLSTNPRLRGNRTVRILPQLGENEKN